MNIQVCIPFFLFKSFDYKIPKKLEAKPLFVGQSVNVPFRNKNINAYVLNISKKCDFTGKVLEVNSINDNSFKINDELWQTLIWISKYYCTPIGKVLNTTIPYQHIANFKYPNTIYLSITTKGIRSLKENKIKFKNQLLILNYLFHNQNELIDAKYFKDKMSSYLSTCNRLEKLGYLILEYKRKVPGLVNEENKQINKFTLTKIQQNIFNTIILKYKQEPSKPIVLSGVSSSGKTIIYSKMIEEVINIKKNIIVMVPEIVLISQTYRNLTACFPEKVGFWHSKMRTSEKKYILSKIKDNDISIIVTTRSGLFLPLKNIGLIVVDEEHSSSYKQEANAPLYHARDVAILRANLSKSSIMLISSTPSLETFHNINKKKYTEVHIDTKYMNYDAPKIKMINMTSIESYQKDCGIISKTLIQYMNQAFDNNEKVILLQNRRGYSYIIKCSNCEQLEMCKLCSSPLIIHKNLMKCHHCNFAKTITNVCSKCDTQTLEQMGTGTQKIQEILKRIFPNKNIIRYDKDSTNKNSNYFNLLKEFEKDNAHILLGTQMLAKGLDFKNVSVIGAINADIGLFQPDFRSGEKVFQLLYQFIGRTGRHQKKSYAIIQTFNPLDKHIKMACQLNLDKMYNDILKEREELFYPPFSKLIRIIIKGKNKNEVSDESYKISHILLKNKNLQILGPSIAPIEKINNNWRYNILIKCEKAYWLNFYEWVNKKMMKNIFETKNNRIKINFDVDPISLL